MTTDLTGALDMGVLLRVLYKMTPENRGNIVKHGVQPQM